MALHPHLVRHALVRSVGWVARSGRHVARDFNMPIERRIVAVHSSGLVSSSASQHFAAGEMPQGGFRAAPERFAQNDFRFGDVYLVI